MPVEPVITIAYTELDESPEEGYTGEDKALGASMRVRCEWDDRHTLARQMLGGVQTIDGIKTYTYPMLYPHDTTGASRLVSIPSIVPEGEPTAGPDTSYKSWKYAVLTLSFGIDQFAITYPTNRPSYNLKVEDSFSGFSDILFIDADSRYGADTLFYGVANTVDGTDALTKISGDDPSRQIHGYTWTRTIEGLSSIPPDIVDWTGSVNETSYQIPTWHFDGPLVISPETLLFDRFESVPYVDQQGELKLKLTLYYNYKWLGAIKTPNVQSLDTVAFGGWNHVFPPGEDEPVRLWKTSNATPGIGTMFRAYPTMDFTDIEDIYS